MDTSQNSSSTTSASPTVHTVTVGRLQNAFSPNSIQANPGDIVTFEFYPSNHSVIRAEYEHPCIPYEDTGANKTGFYSGPVPVATIETEPPTWNLTINDTLPVFYYCGAFGSCIDWGMVGVINPNSSGDIATQIALAKNSDYMLLPGEPFPAEASTLPSSLPTQYTTISTTASTSPTPTSTSSDVLSASTAMPSAQHISHHPISPGAIAGIAIGGFVVLVLAAALFFLLGRTRSLSDMLRHKDAALAHQSHLFQQGGDSGSPFLAHNSMQQLQQLHTGMLPTYASAQHNSSAVKPPDTYSVAVTDMSGRVRSYESFSPPLQQQQQQQESSPMGTSQIYHTSPVMGYGHASELSRLSHGSELLGSRPPVEMYAPSGLPDESMEEIIRATHNRDSRSY